jgi:hypothetical protein
VLACFAYTVLTLEQKSKDVILHEALADLHKVLFAVQLLCLTLGDSVVAIESGDGDDDGDGDDGAHDGDDGERVLLWVDDNPENNVNEVNKFGVMWDIDFVQLTSTRAVQEHLAKRGALRRRSAAHFRLITDRRRVDDPGDAGATLVAWLRGARWRVPCLLYCGDPNSVWGAPDLLKLQATYRCACVVQSCCVIAAPLV